MKSSKLLITCVLLPLVLACSEQSPVVGTQAQAPTSTPTATANRPAKPAARLQMQCGGQQFALVGEGDEAGIERNSGPRSHALRKPDGMVDYVPIGMGCARSSEGDEYLVVEYGEPLIGCSICEWFFVYDRDGQPLNQSVPAMLGGAGSLYPNTQGYTQVTNRLGLQPHEIEYASRPKPLDVEGRSPETPVDSPHAAEPL